MGLATLWDGIEKAAEAAEADVFESEHFYGVGRELAERAFDLETEKVASEQPRPTYSRFLELREALYKEAGYGSAIAKGLGVAGLGAAAGAGGYAIGQQSGVSAGREQLTDEIRDVQERRRRAILRQRLLMMIRSAGSGGGGGPEKKAFIGGGPGRAKQVQELAEKIYSGNPKMDPGDAFAQASRQLSKKHDWWQKKGGGE